MDVYREIEASCAAIRKPGTGQASDATEIHSVDGKQAVFAGTFVDALEGVPPTRICLTDLASGATRVLTFGPNVDRSPKFSPDGRQIAFLSDRGSSGDFQLFLLDPISGAARATARVDGWVEYLQWSPDGKRILLGVAGHGADTDVARGAVASRKSGERASWMPVIDTGTEAYRWRSLWVHDVATDRVSRVSFTEGNVWEAAWCGNDAFAAVVSHGPEEGHWYSAHLRIIDRALGDSRQVLTPRDHIGWPAASPSGKRVSIIEALCSDRGIVAGDLLLIDAATGEKQRVDTRGVDIACAEWRSERHVLVAGHRGLESVIGLCDADSGVFTELWSSRDLTTGGPYVRVCGFGNSGDCVLIGESFVRAPEIAVIRGGEYRGVKSIDPGYAERARVIDSMKPATWTAPDGLEMQGWLLEPRGTGPHPLILFVHGGPVWHTRPTWLGRWSNPVLSLIAHGYAIFFPNPRGSSGRGQDFIRRVFGDVGGADARDLLSGLDALVERGVADPKRLGVMGGSYGGFMTSWLITQDSRFAAAVSVMPHTNHVSAHLLSNISHFIPVQLNARYDDPGGRYFERSPIMHARKAKTPTLNICGALDRCAPPGEAAQFHRALLENDVESVLVTYPEEGHGVRSLPAVIDYGVRIVTWFEDHMPAR